MMKKGIIVLFAAAMLFVTAACKPPAGDPAKYTGKGAQSDMAAPKTVTIPIDVIKSSDFLTRSVRESIVYRTKQAALAANIPQIETTDDPKTNYVDWDLSVGRTEEEALSESLIVKHETVNGLTPGSLAGIKIAYADIQKWFGRDIQVGDEFWLGFRASNQDGKEIARMAHHIKVGNPTKLAKVELKYGFEGWYIKATLGENVAGKGGNYPTATANFFIGADEKSGAKVNEKPINGHVVKDTVENVTLFYCKLPDGKVVEGQPYHIKAHFNDVEFGGDDGISSFVSADVIYAKDADSAWDFQVQGTPNNIALATKRGAVELDTADPKVKWADMKDAAMLFEVAKDNSARIVNASYKARLAMKAEDLEKADPERYAVNAANREVTFDGLQYGQTYFMRIDFSYDVKMANSIVRKTVSSPAIQFKSVNGLESPLYTMDSGRKISTVLGSYPASLNTDGAFVTSGGNPSNALKLDNGKNITSAAVKRYKTAALTFDQIFPSNIDTVIANTIAVAQLFDAKDHKYPGDETYAFTTGNVIWKVTTGTNVEARLVYLPPYLVSDKDNYTTAGKWTVHQGKLVLVVKGDAQTKSDTVKITNAFLTSKTSSLGGLDLSANTYTDGQVVNMVSVALDANAGWLAPYKTEVNFKAGEIEAKMGDKTVTVKITSLVEQYNGYENFKLESAQNGLLVDNVQYKVVDGKVDQYTRSVR